MNRGWKLALLGLAGYPALELLCRRRTHWSMALAGAVTLPLLGRLSRRRELPYAYRMFGDAFVAVQPNSTGFVLHDETRWDSRSYSPQNEIYKFLKRNLQF